MMYTIMEQTERGITMEKRIASLLCLILVLCLSIGTSLAAEYTANGLFTITYDDTLALDDATYAADNTENARWLFMLSKDNAIIDAQVALEDEDYANFSMSSATEEERQAYVDYFLDSYADMDAKLITSLAVSEQSIPFYLYTITDEDGLYYFAETVEKGYSIGFYAYYEDETPSDGALLEMLEGVLYSFQPLL